MILNLIYDAFALAAPQSFRDGMATAASILMGAIYDNITINIGVGYGEYNNGPLFLNQNISLGGDSSFGTYSNLRALLVSHETSAADVTSVNALPNTTTLNGQSSFVIGTAEARALGALPANNGTVDGLVGMGTNFTGSVLIGGALHELTHAMGRVPGASGLSLFRYTSQGNHLFAGGTPAAASYFSIDGGVTKLADFGVSSDPSDFLNLPGSNLTPLFSSHGAENFGGFGSPAIDALLRAARRGTADETAIWDAVLAETRPVVGPDGIALPLIGIDGPAWKRILGELNLAQSLRRRLVTQRPPYQIVLPDHRLDGDPDRWADEIERELDGAREPLEAFFQRAETLARALEPMLSQDVTLPPDGFWERRELGRIKPHLPAPTDDLLPGISEGALARAYAALPAALSCDLSPPGPVATLRLHDLWRRGAFRIPGGLDALRRLIAERIQTNSGEVTQLSIRELQVKRGRISSVTAQPRGESFGCGFVIAGMTTARLCELLGEAAPRRLQLGARALKPVAWRYVTNLLLSAEGLPEGMGENVFLAGDPTRPLDEDNALALHLADAEEPGRACLQVVALARGTDRDYLAGLAIRVRARLHRTLLPFLDGHLVAADSPHEGEAARPMDPVYEAADPGPLGVGATPIATGIKNLFVVGRQTLPGLGLEGELAAAWGAARLISQVEKKRDPLKRDVLLSG